MTMRRTLAILLISILVLPAVLFLGIRFNSHRQDKYEHFYERVMFQVIADQETAGIHSRQQAVIRLMEFVHSRVGVPPVAHPVGDIEPLEILAAGRGWCDQQANVFIQLVRTLPLDGRLVFLKDAQEQSPHSIAEVYLDGEWRVIDPVLGIPLLNHQGKLATFRELAEDPVLFTQPEGIQAMKRLGSREDFSSPAVLFRQEPQIFNTWTGRRKTWLDRCPSHLRRWLVYRYQDLYFSLPVSRAGLTPDQQKLSRARHYALIFRSAEAERLYRELLTARDLEIRRDARYFLGRFFKRQGRFKEALELYRLALKQEGRGGWRPFIRASMGKIYESLGNSEEALHYYRQSRLATSDARIAQRVVLLQRK